TKAQGQRTKDAKDQGRTKAQGQRTKDRLALSNEISVAPRESLNLHHLAGIHPVIRIERALDRAHDLERRAVLGVEELHLPAPDTMLARTRAPHRERPHDHALVQP